MRATLGKIKIRRWLVLAAKTVALLSVVAFAAVAILAAVLPFPIERLERWPQSPCVTDRHGRVLLQVVGADGQWRRPVPLAAMSPWLVQATIAVEDERFRSHCGVDPIAVGRAVLQNVAAGGVVSGASTLTMQICRMLDDRPRTLSAKLVETFRAVQLERLYTKDAILERYLNLAPYGGNLRGVEAAAQAYFCKSAMDLSLPEAALLAGLPQSPARYRPDRHPEAAKARRRTVLARMVEMGCITAEQAAEAQAAPLVLTKSRRPPGADHAAWLALQRRPQGGPTTLDAALQAEVAELAGAYARSLPQHEQIAVVVIDIATAEIRALVGSVDFAAPPDGQVNGVTARRSPGSTLKPFIYAAAFDARLLSPTTMLDDAPIEFGGWTPRNFDHLFAGRVPAGEALRRSLNIPALLVAARLGAGRCAGAIEAAGVDLPDSAATSAGLGLAVGAAEVTLLDLTNGYATLGRGGMRRPVRLFPDEAVPAVRAFREDTCAAINDILSTRRRTPNGLEQAGGLAPCFMWKTGTSSRRRDAWAIGHNGRFAIGVWVGRFSGASSVHHTGARLAEPLLAKLFALPQIRVDEFPPPAPSWEADERWTERPAEPLAILHPAEGMKLLAAGEAAVVAVRARGELSFCFLDGVFVPAGALEDLHVAAGMHELRCVGADGTADAVRFEVRPRIR